MNEIEKLQNATALIGEITQRRQTLRVGLGGAYIANSDNAKFGMQKPVKSMPCSQPWKHRSSNQPPWSFNSLSPEWNSRSNKTASRWGKHFKEESPYEKSEQ